LKECGYPGEPASHAPFLANYPGAGQAQVSWLGPSLQINSVNDEFVPVSLSAPDKGIADPATDTTSVTSVFGVADSYTCLRNQQTMYFDGGVMITKTRGSYVTARTFMFRDDAAKDLALQDDRNAGLPYDQSFKYENGCDAEIVMEIKPKTGGGIHFQVAVPLIAYSQTSQRTLRDNVLFYHDTKTNDVVAVVPLGVLRASQNLVPNDCDTGMRELVRFSTNFICKAGNNTGQAVVANVTLNQWRAAVGILKPIGEVPISNQSSSPTSWQSDPITTWELNSDQNVQVGPTVNLVLSAQQAPESFEAFYWDPAVRAAPGDNRVWKAAKDGNANNEATLAKEKKKDNESKPSLIHFRDQQISGCHCWASLVVSSCWLLLAVAAGGYW